ncbi:MAG TPA: PAS domain S-box protein [Roseomonas sp.]|jgi:PAS domain S-box-containing protein
MEEVLNQPFGHAVADEDGRLLQVNRALCDMLGFEAGALLGRNIRDITHPDDWPCNEVKLSQLCAQEEPFTIVKRHLRNDGSVIWVQNYVSLLRDAEGRVSVSALVRPVLPAEDEAQRWGGNTREAEDAPMGSAVPLVPEAPWKGGAPRLIRSRRLLPTSSGLLH